MRASWSLDSLLGEMAAGLGYADKTALTKSLVRICALVGRESPVHAMVLGISHLAPAMQDKVDEEILRMWRTGEAIENQQLAEIVKRLAEEYKVGPNSLLQAAGEQLVKRALLEEVASG